MSVVAQEAWLDQQEERLDEAYEAGALTEYEYRQMILDLDRQRVALYAREDGEP